MQRHVLNFFLFAVLAMLQVTTAAAAPASVGKAVRVSGEVTASGPTGERVLKRGSKVYSSDKLRTSSNSEATFAFADGAVLGLLENTNLDLEQYAFNPKSPREGRSAMRLLRGGMKTVTGLIGSQNPAGYALRTKVSTLGVRGTQYAAQITSSGNVIFFVTSGVITVTPVDSNGNPIPGAAPVDVPKGSYLTVTPEGQTTVTTTLPEGVSQEFDAPDAVSTTTASVAAQAIQAQVAQQASAQAASAVP